jgi:glycosyltransferase involved in cell wall biosynthesis
VSGEQKKVKAVMLLSNSYNPDDRVRNEALALQEAGYVINLLAWDREGTHPEQELLSGITVKRLALPVGFGQGAHKMRGYLQVWRWFIRELKQIKPDIVICHDFDTFLAGIGYTYFRSKVKLVLDAHENYSMMMKPYASGQAVFVISLLERALTRKARLLISSSQATAEYYRRFGAKRVLVVGNWKDPQAFKVAADAIARKRQELGISPKQLVITYIGALSADRNVLPLLQALRHRPDVFLILGGAGDQEEEIRSACASMQNVYFPGYIHPDEVPLFTMCADVIYYCFDPGNVYAPYNAPNKLYEALAAGKAVLASDLGGELSDVVKKTQCGILLSQVNPDTIGEALDQLKQETSRLAMQERARHAGLVTYNWTLAKKQLQDAYHQLFSEGRL